jgi:DNA uptake protein ComE-like DNA-binding protein
MERKYMRNALALISLLALSLAGCLRTEGSRSQDNPQDKQARDESTREKVADATQKAKEKSKELGEQAKAAAQKAEQQAKVVAQGVKEGWNRDERRVDLNSASEAQLRDLPGVGEQQARRIIAGRPYKTPHELVTRGILTEDEYQGLKNSVAAN